MSERTVELIDLAMAEDLSRIVRLRQNKFRDESLHQSVMVALLNYGDQRRIAHCISGDWSGPKSELAVHDSGLPLCPQCRKPCTEEALGWRLALVNELRGEGMWDHDLDRELSDAG